MRRQESKHDTKRDHQVLQASFQQKKLQGQQTPPAPVFFGLPNVSCRASFSGGLQLCGTSSEHWKMTLWKPSFKLWSATGKHA